MYQLLMGNVSLGECVIPEVGGRIPTRATKLATEMTVQL